jgi:hypothetical protein
MLKGIQLTLLIGPAVPSAAPQGVIDALTNVQINSSRDRSGFQLTFTLGKRSLLSTTLLPAGYFDPIATRVIIVVTLAGVPNVLMDGFITRHELSPSNDPGASTLTVTGEDLSVAMDVKDMSHMRYPGMTKTARVNAILAQYGTLGVTAVTRPGFVGTTDSPNVRIPTHRGTDLAYIRQLASDSGFVFYIEPGPAIGRSIAYFGPDIQDSSPQPALNVNMDAHTNVESLSFSLDGLAKQTILLRLLDPDDRRKTITLPMPNINVYKPPLGARPTPPAKVRPDERAGAHLTPEQAQERAIAIGIESSSAITANGSLDVLRYGRVLRSRRIVGVRGAGRTYDGLYYVDSVTHTLKRGEYKQSFTLSRDGLVAAAETVRP